MDRIKLSDECWLAAALLQREQPNRESFRPTEIRRRIEQEHLSSHLRAGIPAHLSQHLVANRPPDTGRYRMLYRKVDGTLRLFRMGDDYHPERHGKIRPEPAEVPSRYRDLIRWYDEEYNRPGAHPDPLLEARGLGKEMWRRVDADSYVNELRTGWNEAAQER